MVRQQIVFRHSRVIIVRYTTELAELDKTSNNEQYFHLAGQNNPKFFVNEYEVWQLIR